MAEITEHERSRRLASWARRGVKIVVRIVAGFLGGSQLAMFFPGLLFSLGTRGQDAEVFAIPVFFVGGSAVGWGVFARPWAWRILAWSVAAAGAGMILEPPTCFCDGGITVCGLIGAAVAAVGATISCLPGRIRFGRLGVRRSALFGIYFALAAAAVVWAATTPRLDRSRAVIRLRWRQVLVRPSEEEGPVVCFIGLTDDQKVRDAVPCMRRLGEIGEISVFFPRFTDAGLRELAQFETVASLRIAGAKVTDAGLPCLQSMRNLKRLDLTRTQVTDAGIDCLAKMRQLESVNLCDTSVTEVGAERLRQALPKAEIACR